MQSIKLLASIGLLALVACAPFDSDSNKDEPKDDTMMEDEMKEDAMEKDDAMEEEMEKKEMGGLIKREDIMEEKEEEAMMEPKMDAFAKAVDASGGSALSFDSSNGSVSFVGGNHPGAFPVFSATITPGSDPGDFTKAKIAATVDVTSVKTDSGGLDKHLQAEEFFDSANYPEATFTSTSIQSIGENTYSILGSLTLKGTTKSISMDAMLTSDGLTISYPLPRTTYGIGNDSYGNTILDATIPVEIMLEF